MHVGTLVTEGPLLQTSRIGRVLLLVTLLSAAGILAGCASRSTQAPVADRSTIATGTQSAQGTYVVRAGDTLYKIAQDHGMTASRLSELNGISDPTQLAIGQVLRLDSATPRPSGPTVATSGESGKSDTASPAGDKEAPASPARASDANVIAWGWPASGKIIQGFSTSTKGIDIEGKTGDSVVAAADGKVMYAGNGVRGLGNLILLGHSDGFITAYAHNESLLVKTGAAVKKGAKIATVGQSDTTSPRLHFEIRRRGTPVNPLSYLPSR